MLSLACLILIKDLFGPKLEEGEANAKKAQRDGELVLQRSGKQLSLFLGFCFVLGHIIGYAWLCSWESFLAMLEGHYGMPEMELGSGMCKASAIPNVPSLPPYTHLSIHPALPITKLAFITYKFWRF